MKNIVYIIITIIFSTSLFLTTLFFSTSVVVNNDKYFEGHYVKRDIMADTDMTLEDLMIVTDQLISYLNNQRDNLDMQATINGNVEEVFGEREKLHMIDVKNLYRSVMNIKNICLVLAFIIGITLYYKNKEKFVFLLKSIKFVYIGIVGIVSVFFILLIVDFNRYFTLFHLLLFDNDLWLLDPRTDIMINMVPEAFFFETAMWILILFFGLTATLLTISQVMIHRLNR